jgi:hypothetical protein
MTKGAVLTMFFFVIMNRRNKVVFVPGKPFQPSVMLAGKLLSYSQTLN